ATPTAPAEAQAERQGGDVSLAVSVPRYGTLSAFRGDGADRRAYRFGRWLHATVFGNASSREWCAKNGIAMARAGQVEGTNEKGGHLVPDEFGTDMIDL